MGYGPLVRATTGVTMLWTDDKSEGGFSSDFFDATTIFPDHVVARITAIAALASLVRREQSGSGAHVHISQAEAAVNQLAASYVTDAAKNSRLPVEDDPAFHGVFACAGDDEWCVISLRNAADRATLAAAAGCRRCLTTAANSSRRYRPGRRGPTGTSSPMCFNGPVCPLPR